MANGELLYEFNVKEEIYFKTDIGLIYQSDSCIRSSGFNGERVHQ